MAHTIHDHSSLVHHISYPEQMGRYLTKSYGEDWSTFDPKTQDIRIRECENYHYSFRLCSECGCLVEPLNDGKYLVYHDAICSYCEEAYDLPYGDYIDPATLTTLHAPAHNVTDRNRFYAKKLWNNKEDMVIRLTGIKEFDPDDDNQVRQISDIYTTPEQFIEKYKDRVDWDGISQNIRVVRNTIYDYVDPATLTTLH